MVKNVSVTVSSSNFAPFIDCLVSEGPAIHPFLRFPANPPSSDFPAEPFSGPLRNEAFELERQQEARHLPRIKTTLPDEAVDMPRT